MRMVIAALLPVIIFAVYHFGTRALLHILISVVACVLTQFTFEAFAGLHMETGDFSAVVTGIMIALMLPVGAPLWAGAVGGIFAVAVVKMLLGRLLKVRLNAALAGYLFLFLVFHDFMTDFTYGGFGGGSLLSQFMSGADVDPLPMVTGFTNGGIGLTSAAAILLGFVILLAAGVVSFQIPAFACAAFALTLTLLSGNGFDPLTLVIHACGGGFLFIICFMSVDYFSSPVTKWGRILYGIIIGVLSAVLRYAGIEEAAVYAVLASNILVPLLEKFTVPRPFGHAGRLGVKGS